MFRIVFLLNISLFALVTNAQFITHGPVVGGLTHQSARIYLRSTEAAEIRIELAADTSFANVISVTDSTYTWRDSSNLITVEGLNSFTTYYYRIFVNGNLDTIRASFKTFPAVGNPGYYKWAVLSCQEFGTYNVFNALHDRMPQLVLHTGDFTYPDYQIPGNFRDDWSLMQLSYRKRYKEPQMQKDFLSMAFDYVPDNHDGAPQGDNATSHYIDSNGEVHNEIRPFVLPPQALQNVFNGYYEYFPHYPPADSLDGMYHKYRYGNCEIFFIDARHCGNGQDSTYRYDSIQNIWFFDPKPGQSMLGPKQFNWLLTGLKNSTADWKFIVSQVMFNRSFRKVIQVSIAMQYLVFSLGGTNGTGFKMAHASSANWPGFPREQDSLLNFLQSEAIKDVLVLSGHMHTNVMDNGWNAGLPELNTGPAAGGGAEFTFYIDSVMRLLGQGTAIDSLWNGGGQGVNNTNFKSGFGMVEIFNRDSVQLKIVDEDNITVSSMTVLHSSLAPASVHKTEKSQCVIEDLYPNPSSDFVSIRFCDDYIRKPTDRSYLLDLNGKILSIPVSGTQFSVKGLPAGHYVYVYDFGPEVKTFQLQVKGDLH